MQTRCSIFRTEDDLAHGLEEVQALQRRAAAVRVEGGRVYNPGWHMARDLQHMLLVSEAILRSALLRKESRGGHARLDFPAMDPAFGSINHRVRLRGEALEVDAIPLPEMPAELRALFDAGAVPSTPRQPEPVR
jgi:succinate dehydrogenase / fumarate reductase flavoprotein subunit